MLPAAPLATALSKFIHHESSSLGVYHLMKFWLQPFKSKSDHLTEANSLHFHILVKVTYSGQSYIIYP